jgi:hypothetical protein
MNASARGGLSAVVDNLPDQWLYQGAIHGLNKTQENALLQGKYLKTELLSSWYCESCDNDHDYRIITPEKVFKFCPASFEPPQPITQEERTRVWWQPKAMASKLQEANQLAIPSNQEGQLNWFPVGMGGKQLIFISVFFDFERIERCLYELKKESILINLYPLHLTDSQESTLKGKNITVHNFTSVFENNWVLPMGTEAENARLIINTATITITLDGVVRKVTPSEFKTAHIIARSNPKPINPSQYAEELYSCTVIPVTNNTEETPNLTQIVSNLNTKLGMKVFKSKGRNLGYIVEESLTVSIL